MTIRMPRHGTPDAALDARRRSPVLTNQLVNTKRPRGADSPAAILRAAAQEFALRGYDAAGVDRIAAKARVNKAMLYYHYDSKLNLYLEVLRDMFRAVGARTRAIADGPEPAESKIDAWILTLVEEAAARPWFPPIMLRELASGAAHIDNDTFGVMNGVYLSVRDVIVQGQREGTFRPVDPLLTYLTILPSTLIFFARQRVVTQRKDTKGLAAAAPRDVNEFVKHMQGAARGMLRRET
jgi:AcrR family transcriptional regulator